MIVEDCQQLTQQIQTVKSLNKHADDLKKFEKRQSQIADLLNELKPLAKALQAFQNRKLINIDVTQKADGIWLEAASILQEFQSDKSWLIETFDHQPLKRKVKSLKDDLDKSLCEAWQNYKRSKMPILNNELLDLLLKIQDFKAKVQRVKSLFSQIELVRFPQDEEHFLQIEKAMSNLSQEWSSLYSNEVPVDFLKAASNVGAPIDSFTPEVERWLKEAGITRLFQIKLAD